MSDRHIAQFIVKRLKSGDDFRTALEEIVEQNQIKAGVLLSVVGSLTSAALRTPSGSIMVLSEPLELVSGTGTVGSGGIHIHVSVSDDSGGTFGGHLVNGCVVRTTLELVIQNLSETMIFDRITDADTGYKELSVRKSEN
jgi:uncharacterized protein